MKHVMVAGATNFIGFALCKKLIKKEVEVLGLSLNEVQRDEEEKLMEIGRNAFFHFQERKTDEKNLLEREFDVVYFCLEQVDLSAREELGRLQSVINNAKKIFFVLPATTDKNDVILQKLVKNEKVHFVMYPSIFGPWQPESEPIQKRIMEELTGKSSEGKFEVPQDDLMYVDDLAEALLTIGVRSKNAKTISLVNKEKKVLETIADELKLTIIDMGSTENKKDSHVQSDEVFYINSELNTIEALANQRENAVKRLRLDF